MSGMNESVQAYVARQPSLARQRRIMRGIATGVFSALTRLRFTGTEYIPQEGGCIIMINHASLLDPVLPMIASSKRFVVPMTKIENMHNPILGPLIRMWGSYAITRGEVDRTALISSIELIKSGQMILIAPEGTRHKEGLATPKDGFAFVATKANAIVQPAVIYGTENWMKRVLTLQRPHLHVDFGQPFRFKVGEARASRARCCRG